MRPKYLFGEFELNPASRELLRNGKPIALRPRSLECLVYLIEHRDRAVGRDELIAAVWGRVDASDTVVAQTMLRARKALDDTGDQQVMIRTVPRFGYRWVAPVREGAVSRDSNADAVYAGGQVADAATSASVDYAAAHAEADEDETLDDPALQDAALPSALPEVESAEAIDSRIEETTDVSPVGDKRRLSLRFGLALVALVAVLGLGVFLYSHYGREAPGQAVNDAVLVMPVTVTPTNSESSWVRLGAMDYLATRLRGSGVNVLPSEQALRLSAAIEGDTPAEARTKLLALSGARRIVMPEARQERTGWLVRLRMVDGEPAQPIEARGATALAAAAAAADLWLRQLGGQGRLGPPPTPLAERLQRLDAEILAARLPEARRLLASASPAEREDARFLYREAKLEFRAANVDAAADLFQKTLERVSDADMPTKIGALQGLGGTERNRNNPQAAELRFNQSLALLKTLPPDRINSRLVSHAYQGLGIISAQRGDLDACVRYLGQARVWVQRSGDLVSLGTIGHNLGKAESLRGDYAQALREFDRSIEMFERFRVSDYLANSLQERAELQVALLRPADAWESARRAVALVPKVEDDNLAAPILATQARIQLMQGRLRDVDGTLAAMRSRGARDSDPLSREVLLRLHLARGEPSEARKLVASGSSIHAGDDLMLAAVQSATRAGDVALAKSWVRDAPPAGDQDARYHAVATALARALIARAQGDGPAALQFAEQAARVTGMSPEAEVQTGVVQAMILLDGRQYDAASAILGRLEKYADSDYRVAWVMLTLYRALGDQRAAAEALGRVDALRGERDISIEPVL